MWRWLSAVALVAVGLVMGASVAGAQATRAAAAHRLRTPLATAQFHTNPGHFLSGPQPHVAGQSYADESTNWSGQIATGLTFTGMTGSWVVPAIAAHSVPGGSATWIGIDGGPGSPNSIIQTGTAQTTQDGADVVLLLVRAVPGATGLLRERRLPGGPDERVDHQERPEHLEPDDH